MLINKNEIINYLPQRDPFVMIDSLISADKDLIIGQYKLKENILSNKKHTSPSILIEFLAQTCAAGLGYQSDILEEQDKLGFIGAISKLVVFGEAFNGDTLTSQIKFLTSFDQIHLIEGIVMKKDVELLRCQMKIVTP